jgi:NAD(P)-dependent dehydrogenase (short-subunit alcohol dehydrogenase family)
MNQLLNDKVVVLAGLGPGLGQALADGAAEMGAHLVLAARTESKLTAAAEALAERGTKVITVATDVNDRAACERLREATLAEFGRVDVLLNNAFQMTPMDPLTVVDQDKVRASMNTNVFAPLTLSAVFADALEASKGNIVMINSGVLYQSQPEYAAYKMTKGAMLHMSSSLATELGPRGIRVNSIAPSYIYEDVNKMYFDWLASQRGITHQDVYDEMADLNDMKRLAGPEEVANAALFLASDLASAITGICLDVSCGEFHRN